MLTEGGAKKGVVGVDWNYQEMLLEVELGSQESQKLGQAESGH